MAEEIRNEGHGQGGERAVEDTSARWIGWIGIAASIIAFFFAPYIMGGAGIILGIIGLFSNAKTLSWWAIGLGAAAIIIRWFMVGY
ncbi:hypothetical protein L1765_02000 [Microaerobacter geothermalis]|uniref:hypothetical protein n=1 Tax=Microaerobacter geothermalis TaxID=674972 RepID=UPI001F35EEC4|nr:hypothetical protein [Microaerobacter geothermalis]MCF6092767.1 hypothetical protein [Microaerobacter geothermalis]